jgi:hypothetical protein
MLPLIVSKQLKIAVTQQVNLTLRFESPGSQHSLRQRLQQTYQEF